MSQIIGVDSRKTEVGVLQEFLRVVRRVGRWSYEEGVSRTRDVEPQGRGLYY
jgi:hypothetical protein